MGLLRPGPFGGSNLHEDRGWHLASGLLVCPLGAHQVCLRCEPAWPGDVDKDSNTHEQQVGTSGLTSQTWQVTWCSQSSTSTAAVLQGHALSSVGPHAEWRLLPVSLLQTLTVPGTHLLQGRQHELDWCVSTTFPHAESSSPTLPAQDLSWAWNTRVVSCQACLQAPCPCSRPHASPLHPAGPRCDWESPCHLAGRCELDMGDHMHRGAASTTSVVSFCGWQSRTAPQCCDSRHLIVWALQAV